MVRGELMKRAGIPTLILQGDSWIRRMTPIETLQELIQEIVDNVLRRGRRRAARTR